MRQADGSVATVVAVRSVAGAADLWDLTVSQVHTFVVGVGAFVVHNACGDSAKIDFSDNGAIQHEMKHASNFGVSGNYNKATRDAFVQAMQAHMEDADTVEIKGYFGSGGRRAAATHFYNPNTGLNVFAHSDGRFWGAWKLEDGQSASLLATGGFY